MQSNATAHLGACSQCAGEVVTVDGDPLPLSLCPAGLALILVLSVVGVCASAWGASPGWFVNDALGGTSLKPGPMYFCRVRQQNTERVWSDWSGWHQPFTVGKPR